MRPSGSYHRLSLVQALAHTEDRHQPGALPDGGQRHHEHRRHAQRVRLGQLEQQHLAEHPHPRTGDSFASWPRRPDAAKMQSVAMQA